MLLLLLGATVTPRGSWCTYFWSHTDISGLRHAFNFGAITLSDWSVAVAAGFIAAAWFEIYKTITARDITQVPRSITLGEP